MPLDRPVFVLGTGRSGTTLVHGLLARHEAFMTYSNWDHWLGPRAHNLAMRTVSATRPLSAWNWRRKPSKVAVKPGEPYALVDAAFAGFSRQCRPLRADDVTPVIAKQLTELFESKMRGATDQRLLFKWTGYSRVHFMRRIFPDAMFVHVHRDGRAVANSTLHRPWWRGWQGPEQWRWGPLTPEEQAEWESTDKSFVALAAIQWRRLYWEIEEALDETPAEQVIRVAYEDVVNDVVGTLDRVLHALNVPTSPSFQERVALSPLNPKALDRWRDRDLYPEQVALLDRMLADDLARREGRMR